jgi:hypothetical protein
VRQPVRLAIAALVAIAATVVLVTLLSGGDDRKPGPAPLALPATIAVDGPDADTKRDDALPLSPAARAELARAVRATPKPGAVLRELASPLRDPRDPSITPAGVLTGPLAAQETPGCRTRFVRNFSSRNGTPVRVIVWHQTVSFDRPGGADQDGLTALANTRSSGVSWHYLIGGKDGRCTFTVPTNLKAWTQGNANQFAIGIEVQAFGSEPRYVSGAGRAKLLRVTRFLGRRFGIPMRRGLVRNCRVVRSGIVEHSDLGPCGGGHVDVTATGAGARARAAGWNTAPLIAEAAHRARVGTPVDRRTCGKLRAWRRAGRPASETPRNVRRREALARRHLRCGSHGLARTR